MDWSDLKLEAICECRLHADYVATIETVDNGAGIDAQKLTRTIYKRLNIETHTQAKRTTLSQLVNITMRPYHALVTWLL